MTAESDLGSTRQEDPGVFWNARFGAEPTVYGEGPNVFFAEQLLGLTPGRILLPGDGEGRNAVHAAEQGWSVRSFDASSVGVKKALDMAARRGVTIASARRTTNASMSIFRAPVGSGPGRVLGWIGG